MMNIKLGLLTCCDSLLLVVDIQGRLSEAMLASEVGAMTANTLRLLNAAKLLDVPVLLTEQYPQGLGSTLPELIAALPATAQSFTKTSFSCCAADGFLAALRASGRKQVVLLGQEAHVCVLQTAFELLQLGFQVQVVADAVCSRSLAHKELALQRLQQIGASITNHESVLFEWLRDAKHLQFKTISASLR